MKKLENYRLAGVAERIRCPCCIHGENDNIVPLEFAQKHRRGGLAGQDPEAADGARGRQRALPGQSPGRCQPRRRLARGAPRRPARLMRFTHHCGAANIPDITAPEGRSRKRGWS